jgi:hypothetical protein
MDTISRVPLPLCLQVLFGGIVSAFGWIFLGFGLLIATPLLMHNQASAFWKFIGPLLIFPAFGLALILIKFIPGLRALRLMRHGFSAVGTLVAMKRAKFNYPSEYTPFYYLTFRFTTADGRTWEAKYATYLIKPAWQIFYNQANGVTYNPSRVKTVAGCLSIVRKFMPAGIRRSLDNSLAVAQALEPPKVSELQEMVLYLPDNPAVAALPRSFGKGISVDAGGNLHGSAVRGILTAIPPVLVIGGECAYLYLLIR